MRAACGTRCFSACVVRALLCTSTPVESYAIITRFSLALTIQTTRLLLTADKPLLENRQADAHWEEKFTILLCGLYKAYTYH